MFLGNNETRLGKVFEVWFLDRAYKDSRRLSEMDLLRVTTSGGTADVNKSNISYTIGGVPSPITGSGETNPSLNLIDDEYDETGTDSLRWVDSGSNLL